MGTGAIIWTFMALTIHQGPIQEYPMSSRHFKIPIKIDARRIPEVRELLLLMSKDKGKNWEQVDNKPPTEQAFIFHAPEDGSYWFIVQQIDQNKRALPEYPDRVKPNMAVVVDTTKPFVKVRAERTPSGEIRAHWTITDQYPDARSVRLDYLTSAIPEHGDWIPILVQPLLEGSHAFNPGQAGQTGEVRVRVQAKDQAGNQGEDVFVISATAAPTSSSAAKPAEVTPFMAIPGGTGQPVQTAQLTSQPRPQLDPTPPSPTMSSPPTPPAELNPGNSAPLSGGLPTVANSTLTQPPGNTAETAANAPAVKIVRARDVRLDFTVAKVGPSGLGNADIYVTLDKGVSWKRMPGEVAITLPPNADLHGTEPITGSVSVQLPTEATIYGFIVAVKSKAGLAPPSPKPNDPPEALVELDSTAPKGQLFRPQPDPTQANTLLLAWEAKDRNLSDKPITLEWSEQKDGPWTVIGEGPLPNTGQYPWRLPEHLPPRVYLRLTMRDQAGNESIAKTDKPELIDLSVPQTKIIGVGSNTR